MSVSKCVPAHMYLVCTVCRHLCGGLLWVCAPFSLVLFCRTQGSLPELHCSVSRVLQVCAHLRGITGTMTPSKPQGGVSPKSSGRYPAKRMQEGGVWGEVLEPSKSTASRGLPRPQAEEPAGPCPVLPEPPATARLVMGPGKNHSHRSHQFGDLHPGSQGI